MPVRSRSAPAAPQAFADADSPDPLSGFSALTREWFTGAFSAPTLAQTGAWASIAAGQDTLVVAPTGSGKTLAAFLWALDRLAGSPAPADPKARCRVLYISPLKALAVDIERNLRAPLAGMRQVARARRIAEPDISVAVRTGDTATDERRRMSSKPPDILITTPESLFLILTSRAREALCGVETVILDEVHALAGNKRGAHLALSLERLDALREAGADTLGADLRRRGPAQRIGLSATVRPAEEVAAFLGGSRPVTITAPRSDKRIELRIVVPVEDMNDPGATPVRGTDGSGATAAQTALAGDADGGAPASERSIWRHVEESVLDLIESHRSTIVFANSRRLAERLCGRLNELAGERADARAEALGATPGPAAGASGTHRTPAEMMAQAGTSSGAPPEVARAHHGSVSRQERIQIEEALKAGRLPAVVATSSLELGIDMGAVDLVVQVESPPSVASGLQRTGRAGHNVGDVSRSVIFPKYPGDLVQATVVASRMREGGIEELSIPRNPLDVLAQQIVAMVAMDEWRVTDLERVVRRAAPFSGLTRPVLDAVLDMLAGRYPSEEFAELRPRLVWDRTEGTLHGRPGSQHLAVTSGGTIPDRGLFGVFLAGSQRQGKQSHRVGELDEEMVYESRVGDVFVLGATSWRIEDITADQVLVSPAPGQPGKLPFWHGDAPGRPAELGRAVGAFCRELAAMDGRAAGDTLAAAGLDELAAANLLRYLDGQREATGYLPDDRTLVMERFRDELGDWRLVLHSPYGARVHAPWALAIAARLRERYAGMDVQALHTDDGIVVRVPDADEPPPAGIAVLAPEEVEPLVTAEVGGSALFASRFRECAARALLLPRRRPGRRSPLWQQRQRSAQLLAVASKYGTFPIVLETVRECLQDTFDVPALTGLMRDLATRKVRLVEVETPVPSPFARSLLFRYVGAFMYEGDSPLAERRAQALALDSSLLADLLGQADLRELLDPGVVTQTEQELQRLAPQRHARGFEAIADMLRTIGPLSADEVALRCEEPARAREWLAELSGQRRVIEVRIGGEARWAAVEDAGRLRDALGVPMPPGVPVAFLEPVADPLSDLVARYARSHGPFTTAAVAARYGLGTAVVSGTLHRLAAERRVAEGEFLPGGRGTEWCDVEILRLLRRRCLAKLRKEAEPVPPEALAAFLPVWQSAAPNYGHTRARAGRAAGPDAVYDVVTQLAGAAIPASALETLVLPGRLPGYQPSVMDELTSAGEVVWAGAGGLPGGDGWVAVAPAHIAPLLLPAPAEITMTPVHEAVLAVLAGGGGMFFRMLSDRVAQTLTPEQRRGYSDNAAAAAIWDLVWAGYLTNDTLAPLRTVLSTGRPVLAGDGPSSRAGPGSGAGGRMRSLPGGAARVNGNGLQALPQAPGRPETAGELDMPAGPGTAAELDPPATLEPPGGLDTPARPDTPGDGQVQADQQPPHPGQTQDGWQAVSSPQAPDGWQDPGDERVPAEEDDPDDTQATADTQEPGYPAEPGYPPSELGHPPTDPRHPPAEPGHPAGEAGFPGNGPGQPANAPEHSQAEPGHPANDRGYPQAEPGRLPAEPEYLEGEPGHPANERGYPQAEPGHPPNEPGYPAGGSGYPAGGLRVAGRGGPWARGGGGRRHGYGRAAMPSRTGPPTVTGRWSLLPEREPDPTRRMYALAQTMIDRHGILTRGAVAAERVPGGFSAVYPVLRAMEEAGQCRRGYFVEGLGAAQFALPGAVDRMRALASTMPKAPIGEGDPATAGDSAGTGGNLAADGPGEAADDVLVLAAGDPANPYGSALPWPERPDEVPGAHRPGRKAGALVVLRHGHLVLYVERGGKTLLSWTSDPGALTPAAAALAGAVRAGALGRVTVERADGSGIYETPLAQALAEAGFRPTPRGLRLRG